MSKSNLQNNNVPKLRFKEFNNFWNKYSLKSISDSFLKGRGISKEDIVQNGKNSCIRYGELYTTYSEVITDVISKTNVQIDTAVVGKIGDVLFPSSGETALDIARFSALQKDGVILSGDLNAIRLKNGFDANFIAYYLSHFRKKDIAKYAQGNSVVHLYSSSVQKIQINLPTFEEQRKISNFLRDTDVWIDNLKQQRAKLEEYKRGVMQKIFTQKIRFNDVDGKKFPDWTIVSVSSFLKERKEYSIKGNGLPHISLTVQGVVPKSERYHRDFLVNDDTVKKYKVTRLNDLCYNPANLKFNVIALNKLGDGIFSPIYITYEIKNQCVDFVGYYLTHSSFINKARRFEEGTVYERMAVNPKDFLTVKMSMPSMSEQKIISTFLSSIDELIFAKEKQIKNAESWKKGLLQKMFV